MSRLEAALSKLVICPMWNNCPARLLVQDYKRKYFYPPKRQPRVEQKGQHIPRDNPVEPGESDDTEFQFNFVRLKEVGQELYIRCVPYFNSTLCD